MVCKWTAEPDEEENSKMLEGRVSTQQMVPAKKDSMSTSCACKIYVFFVQDYIKITIEGGEYKYGVMVKMFHLTQDWRGIMF